MVDTLAHNKNRLLDLLPPEDLAQIAPSMTDVDMDKGRLLFDPGDQITTIYFPVDGVISIMTLMTNGEAIESATIGREGAYGLSAAISPREALSRAIVQVPGRAYRVGASVMHDLWKRSSALQALVNSHGDALFAHSAQSVACNALHSVEQRFCRWILSCHDRTESDTVNLTQEFLADMLGVQRTTVTAVARILQAKDMIRYRRGVVDILDRQGLEGTSCECYGVVRGVYDRLLPSR